MPGPPAVVEFSRRGYSSQNSRSAHEQEETLGPESVDDVLRAGVEEIAATTEDVSGASPANSVKSRSATSRAPALGCTVGSWTLRATLFTFWMKRS